MSAVRLVRSARDGKQWKDREKKALKEVGKGGNKFVLEYSLGEQSL